MSGTNYRTWQTYHVGHVLVTVQLDPVADVRILEKYSELADVARQLILGAPRRRVGHRLDLPGARLLDRTRDHLRRRRRRTPPVRHRLTPDPRYPSNGVEGVGSPPIALKPRLRAYGGL